MESKEIIKKYKTVGSIKKTSEDTGMPYRKVRKILLENKIITGEKRLYNKVTNKQIEDMLSAGYTYKQTAKALGISPGVIANVVRKTRGVYKLRPESSGRICRRCGKSAGANYFYCKKCFAAINRQMSNFIITQHTSDE